MNDQMTAPGGRDHSQRIVNIVALLLESLAFITVVFLRRGFGDKFVDLQAGVALLLLIFYGFFFPGHDLTLVHLYLSAFILMCVRHRFRKKAGLSEHSRYSGTPRLMRVFPRVSESTIKRWYEPGVVMAVGFVASFVDDPFAGIFIWSGIGILFNEASAEMAMKQRISDMNDLYLEQRGVLDRFRRERGDYVG